MKKKPTIAVTLGDPTGIGPEVIRKALQDSKVRNLAQWKILGERPKRKKISPKQAGRLSLKALKEAVAGLKAGQYDALVTGPVSKSRLQASGFRYPGHTEYLSHQFKAKKMAMMIASPRLKIVLATIHIPLKNVSRTMSTQNILEKIELVNKCLKKDFGIMRPRIAVCGFNPHAGEGGLFGTEEKKFILPAIKKAKMKKFVVSGPHPPDTVFFQAIHGRYDVVLCHYHDQGLIPLKTLAFHEGVNMTLGLPIIRTSPDHGCAFDIAGKGIADPSSMKAAMKMAVEVWRNRNKGATDKTLNVSRQLLDSFFNRD